MNNSHRFIRRATVPLLPAALTLVPDAEAQVIYTPDQNLQISASDPAYSRIFFDLDHSGSGPYAQFVSGNGDQPLGTDFSTGFGTMSNGESQMAAAGVGKIVANNSILGAGVAGTGQYDENATRFSLGAEISGAAAFRNYDSRLFDSTYEEAQWQIGDSGYVGLALGEGYGWARLSSDADSITLHDFAFNPDGAILAGATTAVPEPATSAMLAAVLAGGVAVFHRRRQKKTVAAEPVN